MLCQAMQLLREIPGVVSPLFAQTNRPTAKLPNSPKGEKRAAESAAGSKEFESSAGKSGGSGCALPSGARLVFLKLAGTVISIRPCQCKEKTDCHLGPHSETFSRHISF